MDELRRFDFYPKERRNPYVEHLYEFSLLGAEGVLHFDGYYYIQDEDLPTRSFFITTVREPEPYMVEGNCESYRVLEEEFYEIEIYSREIIENTSSYDEVEEEDGTKMRICYYPTHEQKIKFRVISKFNTYRDFLERSHTYYIEERTKMNR